MPNNQTIRLMTKIAVSLACAGGLFAQEPVTIRVDLASSHGAWNPAWTFFGYDEPNYTYTKNGRKLLAELARILARKKFARHMEA